jgi:hypothetical protein
MPHLLLFQVARADNYLSDPTQHIQITKNELELQIFHTSEQSTGVTFASNLGIDLCLHCAEI